ncbi:MAG: hypothetical protein GC157_04015 [Frankiales bacterium]|nr:hypothetical protein [Frankiales bacterium]
MSAAGTTLYLGGGGSADDERALWSEFVEPGARIVLWPFAVPRSGHDRVRLWLAQSLEPWDGVRLSTWTDLAERRPAELADVDVLFVAGGNTFDLLDHVQRTGWLAPTREHVLAGGAYYGGSAGAVLAGADIDVASFADPNDAGVTDTRGLDLLGGAIVRPHATPHDIDECASWSARTGRPVLALPERGGLVVRDGVGRSVGPDDAYAVTGDGLLMLPPDATVDLR